jgi:hypothetical protein
MAALEGSDFSPIAFVNLVSRPSAFMTIIIDLRDYS